MHKIGISLDGGPQQLAIEIMIAEEQIKTRRPVDLLPTQMTVGQREVHLKRLRWREKSSCQATNFLNKLRIPVVLGPNARIYLIDRHHLTLALHDDGVRELSVALLADFSRFNPGEFWTTLERLHWAHPFDGEGRRRCYPDMPETIDDLKDDPFRSLAGALKRAGGFAKDKAPFSEFRWADFLRCRIARELVEHDFGRALAKAMQLAQTTEAAELPGWRRFPD